MKKILGFDVSSTTTAYCLLTVDSGKILSIDYGYIKPIKSKNIFERLSSFEKEINSIITKLNPTEIAIEDIIQFMGRNSSANTIITLSLFNRTVGLAAYKNNFNPFLYAVSTIRSKIKINTTPKKEEIPQLLETRFNITFPYLYSKQAKLKNGKLKPIKIKQESYDLGDAFAVAFCHAIKTNELK